MDARCASPYCWEAQPPAGEHVSFFWPLVACSPSLQVSSSFGARVRGNPRTRARTRVGIMQVMVKVRVFFLARSLLRFAFFALLSYSVDLTSLSSGMCQCVGLPLLGIRSVSLSGRPLAPLLLQVHRLLRFLCRHTARSAYLAGTPFAPLLLQAHRSLRFSCRCTMCSAFLQVRRLKIDVTVIFLALVFHMPPLGRVLA